MILTRSKGLPRSRFGALRRPSATDIGPTPGTQPVATPDADLAPTAESDDWEPPPVTTAATPESESERASEFEVIQPAIDIAGVISPWVTTPLLVYVALKKEVPLVIRLVAGLVAAGTVL